jgi:aspartate aminotransferase
MLEHIKDEFVERTRDEFQSRRDALFYALKEIPGVAVHKPKGAFYTVVQLPVNNAEEFAAFLLAQFSYKKSTTFIAPAAGFYMQNSEGVQKARFAFVLKTKEIEAAIEALAAGLEQYLRS